MKEINISAIKIFVDAPNNGDIFKIMALTLNENFIKLDLDFSNPCTYRMLTETSNYRYFCEFMATGLDSNGQEICYKVKLNNPLFYPHCAMEFSKLVSSQM